MATLVGVDELGTNLTRDVFDPLDNVEEDDYYECLEREQERQRQERLANRNQVQFRQGPVYQGDMAAARSRAMSMAADLSARMKASSRR